MLAGCSVLHASDFLDVVQVLMTEDIERQRTHGADLLGIVDAALRPEPLPDRGTWGADNVRDLPVVYGEGA